MWCHKIRHWLLICLCLWGCSTMLQAHGQTAVGPHGGRMLHKEAVSLELLMAEQAMPAHFRAYVYQDNKLQPPTRATLHIKLTRFNGEQETIIFEPAGDFLQSIQPIKEPHSFHLTLSLTLKEQNITWDYDSFTGRMTLAPAILAAAQIKTVQAQGGLISKQLHVFGKIMPNRDTSAPVYPRYSGIIKKMHKNLGDKVVQGEALVTIESNESLQNYTINSPITGTVVQKLMTTGELAKGDKAIYELANLNNVWADLTLYRKDAPLIKQGMSVTVTGDEGKPQSNSTISYISPLGIEDSQTVLARAVLVNEPRQWLPGMYVNAAIVIHQQAVTVAIPHAAIQYIEEQPVVFIQRGDEFEATPITLGLEDEQWAEVKTGLNVGEHYVINNSFYLKAELGKDGASHEH